MNCNNGNNTTQAAWIGAGRIVSLAFGLVSTAVLSRYLSKADYGTYKQVFYVYGTLSTVFTLGIPRAYSYFLARASIEEGVSIVRKINGLFLLLGVAFAIVLFSTSSVFADILNNPALKINLLLFSITPVFKLPLTGIGSIMVTYKKAHINTVYVLILHFLSLPCVLVPVVCVGASVEVAVCGSVVSAFLCCLTGLYLEHRLFRKIQRKVTRLKIRDIFSYSIPLMVAGLWGIIISSANQFFVSRYWSIETFAEFSNGFVELPFARIIVGSAATVLLPVFSKMVYEHVSQASIIELWHSVAIKSAKIIYPLSIFAFFYAESIIILLYGDQYADSAVYFRIITVVNLCRIVQYAPLMMALGKVKEYARVQMLTAVMLVVSGFVCVKLCSSPYSIAVGAVLCIISSFYLQLRYICKGMDVTMIELIPYRMLLSVAAVSAVASAVTKVLVPMLPDMPVLLLLIISFALFVVFYLFLCKFAGISYINMLTTAFKR